MAEYSFTLSGLASPAGGDPLGLWHVSEDQVSFGAGVSGPADDALRREPTWRIELPESPAEARAILMSRMRALELAQRDLVTVSQELARLSATREVSFSASEEFLAQKTALLEAVDEFREVSYGLLPKKIEDQESYRQWLAFVEQIRQMAAHYAWIETALDGSNVGLTTVGWTGDFATTWELNISVDAMQTHLMSVHLTLDSRIALMRVVSVVAIGAAGLAVKAAIPGGQVLLLPAVWRFVRDVLAELRQSWPKLQHLS